MRSTILVDGRDLREFTLESLRTRVSVILQDSSFFVATVRENIALGSPSATGAKIEQAVRDANARSFVSALPDGYDTVLGERGVALSCGQRQRLAIARAAGCQS